MIARYEILLSLDGNSPQTASRLWSGAPVHDRDNMYLYLHKLERAGHIKRVGKARKNVDYFPNHEIGGWGILWALTKKGEKFCEEYIYPNHKRGRLIRAGEPQAPRPPTTTRVIYKEVPDAQEIINEMRRQRQKHADTKGKGKRLVEQSKDDDLAKLLKEIK